MSQVDTFDHEYLGTLGYLPIYHPLVSVEDAQEFSCTPENLLLGGGSGEHPALIIHRLDALVANFLCEFITDETASVVGMENVKWLEEAAWTPRTEILEYHRWSLRDAARLVQMAESPSFASPLRPDQSAEDWLITSLGEFIYYSLPDLNPVPAAVLSAAKNIDIRPIMGNVMTIPPGYPPHAGRQVIDGDLKWGNCRWGKAL